MTEHRDESNVAAPFDPVAYEREVLGEQLLDGLSQIHYQLADLRELLADPMDHLDQPRELLDRLDVYLEQVGREIVQAQGSITKELG